MMPEITFNKEFCGGKACIRGTRIRVIDVIERYKILKEPPEEIANVFGIPIKAVFSALSYYYEHPQEIRKEIIKDKEFLKKMKNEMKAAVYAS